MSVLSVLKATMSYFFIQTRNHTTTTSSFFSSSFPTVSATISASPSSMQLLLQNKNIQPDNGDD